MPPAVQCRNLKKSYPDVVAVDGVDLDVARGICFGLLGPNGAGKTTTVEILEGLTPSDSGSVEILGRAWGGRSDNELRGRIGIQLQESLLPPKLTVREIVRLFRSFYGAGRELDEVIGLVALEDKADARYEKLSGGQKQRLSLATALVGRPELLFLDEPTTGLDPQARLKVWEIVQGFRDGGGTVVLTTHYMEEATQLCDRVAIIDHGKVIAEETPRNLVASIGAEQILEFRTTDDREGDERESDDRSGRLSRLPGVTGATRRDGSYVLSVSNIALALPAVLEQLETSAVEVAELRTHQPTLEDVFVRLTGRGLRDG